MCPGQDTIVQIITPTLTRVQHTTLLYPIPLANHLFLLQVTALFVMEPSYLFLLSNQDLISSYLIKHLIFHLISDYIISCLMTPSLLRTHGLRMYLILLTDTNCALLCNASCITHVEHSRIPYQRIPRILLIVIACTDTWQFTI